MRLTFCLCINNVELSTAGFLYLIAKAESHYSYEEPKEGLKFPQACQNKQTNTTFRLVHPISVPLFCNAPFTLTYRICPKTGTQMCQRWLSALRPTVESCGQLHIKVHRGMYGLK